MACRLIGAKPYINQCCIIVNWTLANIFQWKFNQNTTIFIEEIACENVVCEMVSILSRPQYVNYRLRHCPQLTSVLIEHLSMTSITAWWPFLACLWGFSNLPCWQTRHDYYAYVWKTCMFETQKQKQNKTNRQTNKNSNANDFRWPCYLLSLCSGQKLVSSSVIS